MKETTTKRRLNLRPASSINPRYPQWYKSAPAWKQEVFLHLDTAIHRLRFKQTHPGLLWPIVDAAGLVAQRSPRATGAATPTGRGFKVIVPPKKKR